ncbi:PLASMODESMATA CALLOSE-BINDING PROTEIN 3 [Dendrobium catenatum]|uniref:PLASMODESMATA CALLOSE-BINDING PROTEIN 3 n=1 Tax=Dendrobium catenatum TaxID=906689 RepID=UPI0009F23E5A|nr:PLASMODESMATA CALLOSE-BINDING PROTEIN 3 [Dendrobium catenatum]
MTSSVMEALLLFVVLVFTMTGGSDGAWCVCRQDMSDSTLQKTIDYACGAGADCSPINQNGVCYNPNTVKFHCSYAVNSYYQRKGQNPQACGFAGTAALTQQDPSSNGCTYPAASSAAGTSTGNNNGAGMGTGNGTSPVTGSGAGAGAGNGAFPTPVGTNPVSTTPSTTTPTTSSGTGGVMGGLGPSGNVISTDNNSRRLIPIADFGSLLNLILSVLVLFRA